jgi:hypothetical protein
VALTCHANKYYRKYGVIVVSYLAMFANRETLQIVAALNERGRLPNRGNPSCKPIATR